MQSIFSLAFLSILLVFTSCSSLPSLQEIEKDVADYRLPHIPKKGYGAIYVVRPSILGGIVRFNVFLDDKEDSSEMGWNRDTQFLYFYAKPGIHTVYSKAENWASIDINVKEDDSVFIQQDASMGLIMARNSLVKIDKNTGKYHVKRLKQGTMNKKVK